MTWFQEEVRRGMDRRFPGGIPEEPPKQAEYEMDVIIQMGFPAYFLVVADFIMWAKNTGHRGRPGPWLRGRFDRRVRAWASPTSTRSRTA